MSTSAGPFVCHRCGASAVSRRAAQTPLSLALASQNSAPVPLDQIASIKRQVKLLDGDIEAVDSHIQSLENTLLVLRDERRRLQSSRRVHIALLAPVRRLPNELLSNIFIYAAGLNPEEGDPNQEEPMQLNLGRVCSTWRNIALTTPRLWNDIHLLSRDKWALLAPAQLREIWLPRSGSLPLHITMPLPFAYETGRALTTRHLALLIDAVERWQAISLVLTGPQMQRTLRVPFHLPVLRHLRLGLAASPLDSDDVDCLGAFECAPLLYDVQLTRIPLSHIRLPWRQLTRLHVADRSDFFRLTEVECIRMLRECFQLECFVVELEWAETSSEISSTSQHVFHDRLKDLDLDWSDPDETMTVFSAVTLPALARLSLSCEQGFIIWDHQIFMTFVHRSHCQLRALMLEEICVDDDGMMDIFSAMPTIEELKLIEFVSDDGKALFESLTYPDIRDVDAQCLLPHLMDLTISANNSLGTWLHETALIGMVRSRLGSKQSHAGHLDPQRHRAQLRKFHLGGKRCMKLDGPLMAEIPRWKEAGLYFERLQ